MGGGRGATVSYLLTVALALTFSRRWFLMFGIGTVLASFFVFINLNPSSLLVLNDSLQRSTSILVFHSKGDATFDHLNLRTDIGSDEWHHRLAALGFQRWTANPGQFLFGTGAKPFDTTAYQETTGQRVFDAKIQAAADSGYYESGLWAVLALTGLAGMIAYLLLFRVFWRKIFRYPEAAWASRDGRFFQFMSIAAPFNWFVTAYLQGGFPSYEIMVVGLAAIYITDRHEEEVRAREAEGFVEMPAPVA